VPPAHANAHAIAMIQSI